ncbi:MULTISPECIES: ornithine cyclodeaminase family protein [unclassified Clostridium]|uniref:ornithine cyclodeaminase family protein n=1 Tax=unclassified Clostridium TaxID=2614128 RepID=UPI00110648CA|nr:MULTISPECIES: ornithine cyclodeaminase family protein [unclassified Clostridium]
MILLSKEDISKVFTMKEAIEADKEAFELAAKDACNIPLRTNIQAPGYDGCFLFMPAYVENMDMAALKMVNIFPHNRDKGIPVTSAQIILIDGKTGVTAAVLDGTYVTQLRTGAASGVAFDILAKKDCVIGALIGTGGQAETQLEAMLVSRSLEQVKVYDLDFDRTNEFALRMQKKFQFYNAEIIAVKSSDEAIHEADLIITATTSAVPVFDGNKIKKGATVSCVGAYQPHMQEMDPVVLQRAAKIYFDSMDAVLSESGDIIIPLSQGIISKESFTGNIGDVITGQLSGRENDEEILVFETVGIAIQDLITARSIYEKAKTMGVGLEWG